MTRTAEFSQAFPSTLEGHGSWMIRLRTAVIALTVGALFFGCAASRETHHLWEEFGNQTFPSEWTLSGTAPLKNGIYREPVAPGSATEIVIRLTRHWAIGNPDGRPAAAAVIVTEPGGSGSFYNLALLQRFGDGWEVTHHVLLGDRIRIEALGFDNNGITIEMITHGPGDPMCCPTRKTSTRFLVKKDRLQKTLPPEAIPLTGKVWKWHGTETANAGMTTPEQPENYTLEFLENGLVQVQADCNSAGGGFMVYKDRISIDVAYSTMAACPPLSLEHIFTKALIAADRFFFHRNQLHLMLTDGSGKMIFVP